MRASRALVWVCALAAITAGCRGRDDLDGRRREIPGLLAPGRAFTLELGDARPVFDLYDNRAAAVVHDAGAVVIECGTADMAKYVEGAYRSPWRLNAMDQGRRTGLIHHLAGELYLPIDGDAGGVARGEDGSVHISLRARAASPRQLVSVFFNERRLGDISMPTTDWKTYQIRAPGSTVLAGENKLRFYFRHTGEVDGTRTAAAFERIRVGSSGAVEAPALAAEPVTHGDARMDALRVSRAARLSFYVAVPAAEPALLLAHAAPANIAPTPLAVHLATADHSAATPIWQGQAGAGWAQARIDLSAHAGQVVRLDLISEGPVDWGRPQIVAGASAPSGAAADSAVPAAGATGSLGSVPARPGRADHAPVDHVIVWVVSALRADRVAGSAVPTPAFARLAGQGLHFRSAFTAAPVPGAAHVALLTGIHPQQDAVPAEAQTLGERFAEAGFVTALISGNGFINDEVGFARGFAEYQNPMRLRHPYQAHILWQKARRLLHKHRNGQTFLYIVTVEPHLPYIPDPDSLAAQWDRGPMAFEPAQTIAIAEAVASGSRTLTREEQAYVQALYNAEVRDADAAFGRVLSDIEELGIGGRTAVILVGDHGEEMFERGGFGHGRHLHDEVLRVPLIIAYPDARSGQSDSSGSADQADQAGRSDPRAVLDWDVSLVDLHATVLGLAGIPPSTSTQGVDLLAVDGPPALPMPIFAHLPGQGRSLKLGRYKLIVPAHGAHALYDLVADPGEQRNLMGSAPLIERYLRNVFGIGVAYQSVWSRQRWGQPGNVKPAFAADHGL